MQWSQKEAARLSLLDGIRFLQLFELAADWQEWPQKSFWKTLAAVALDPRHPVRGSARKAAHLVKLRTQLYDACREDADTGAFLISCPSEFATAIAGVKFVRGDLRAQMRTLHEQLREMPYGPDVFRHEGVSDFFSRMTSLAPKAFSGAWRPAGAAIYVRYCHQIQFGKVSPDELVRDFRLVAEIEGADSARIVGFLLGIALGPTHVQSLARQLQGDKYLVAVSMTGTECGTPVADTKRSNAELPAHASELNPKESMRGRLLRAGLKVSAPTGRGVVIGTGGPVEKKDDQPK
jgi:hypothetical protein